MFYIKATFHSYFFADQIIFREKNVRSAAPYRGSQLEKSVAERSLVNSTWKMKLNNVG